VDKQDQLKIVHLTHQRDEFKERGKTFNGYVIKDFFPNFIKTRRMRKGIKETYYKFEL
jgi:hypothetical protein